MSEKSIKSRQQQTIATSTSLSGFGFWSGLDINVEFRPAPPGSGITFIRADLAGQPRIPALIENQTDAMRRTTLVSGSASVEMIEHLMAALYGLEIDNCEVWVTSAEMPGFDGSSKPFVDALIAANLAQQTTPRTQIIIDKVIHVGNDDSWIEARPHRSNQSTSSRLTIAYELDYAENEVIGKQAIEVEITKDTFAKQLAGARTFLLQAEADWLREQGIGRRVGYHDVLVFGDKGVIDNRLHYSDECVRHKTLDVLGDIAMIGCDVVGEIHAHRSGHILNAAMVRALKEQCKLNNAPQAA